VNTSSFRLEDRVLETSPWWSNQTPSCLSAPSVTFVNIARLSPAAVSVRQSGEGMKIRSPCSRVAAVCSEVTCMTSEQLRSIRGSHVIKAHQHVVARDDNIRLLNNMWLEQTLSVVKEFRVLGVSSSMEIRSGCYGLSLTLFQGKRFNKLVKLPVVGPLCLLLHRIQTQRPGGH